MHATVRKVLVVVLAALLAAPTTLAAGDSVPAVPDDLEGVILDSIPDEWGDVVSPTPTMVPDLYVVVAQPYLALDPRADSFAARWGDDGIDPADPVTVAEMLADPDFQRANALVFSLWQRDGSGIAFLGFVDVRVVGGEFTLQETRVVSPRRFDGAIASWRHALLDRIRSGDRLRDERFAAEVVLYTALSRDEWVRDYWLTRLMSPGEDCSQSVQGKDDCHECCEDAYEGERYTCDGAGVLAAGGACFISAACGPAWGPCCAVFGGFAGLFVRRPCQRNIDRKVNRCTRECKDGLDALHL